MKLSGGKQVTFTGHSLGGGLAIYEAVVHGQAARGFSAADPWNMLSPGQRKAAEKLQKKGMLIDYRNEQDVVTGATNRITGGWKPDAIALTIWCANDGIISKGTYGGDGHGLQYYRFNANGMIDALAYQPELCAAACGSLSADYEALERGRRKCLKIIAYLENLKKLNDSVPSRVREVYADAYNKTSSTIWGLLDESELNGMARERGVYYTQAYSQAAVEESSRKIQAALNQLHEVADAARTAITEFSDLDNQLAALGARFAPVSTSQETTVKQDK